jgi:hypothetical protein
MLKVRSFPLAGFTGIALTPPLANADFWNFGLQRNPGFVTHAVGAGFATFTNFNHTYMDTLRMVRVGNRILNLTQITFAEYTPAFIPPPAGHTTESQTENHPVTPVRPEPKPASLLVHFVGGEQHTFHGDLADELNEHFDLLV